MSIQLLCLASHQLSIYQEYSSGLLSTMNVSFEIFYSTSYSRREMILFFPYFIGMRIDYKRHKEEEEFEDIY